MCIRDRKAITLLAVSENNIKSVHLVKHFGPNYDFRNKRLPVFQVDFNTPNQDTLFIDSTSLLLVDRNTSFSRLESLSFSFLHKWNVLTPLLGRLGRDVVISIVLIAALMLTIMGVMMKTNRKRSIKPIKQEVKKETLKQAA